MKVCLKKLNQNKKEGNLLKTIIIISIFYFIAHHIIKNLRHLRTGEPEENNSNYWMFTYDFKETKKSSIFDRDSTEILEKRKIKNKLIILLYLTVVILFIYSNLFFTQLLLFILEKN